MKYILKKPVETCRKDGKWQFDFTSHFLDFVSFRNLFYRSLPLFLQWKTEVQWLKIQENVQHYQEWTFSSFLGQILTDFEGFVPFIISKNLTQKKTSPTRILSSVSKSIKNSLTKKIENIFLQRTARENQLEHLCVDTCINQQSLGTRYEYYRHS